MIRFCRQNKDAVIAKMLKGQLDAVHSSNTNIVDEIILAMHKNKVLQCLEDGIPDKRANNASIPFGLALTLSATAKMKIKTSLTDIPFALTDSRTISQLGYSLYSASGNLKKGFMRESSLRALIENYDSNDFINGYNNTVQNYIMPKLNISPDIHILDCVKLCKNVKNKNYEGSGFGKDNNGKKVLGYKLAVLRGITGDVGIHEDIRFGSMDIHDMELSRDMLYDSPVLKRGDILINDRGFIARDMINYLKNKRGVDTYVPLRNNMNTYEMAVSTAKLENKWSNHPNKNRKSQRIAFVPNIGQYWIKNKKDNNVDLNACVVWDNEATEKDKQYFVFVTTDLTKSAREIVKTYELRPEIEEDFRQVKDFWKLEDFKSTKLNFIAFHIICTLIGYLFFQIFTMLPEGEKYAHKCLPVILKNYVPEPLNYIVFYQGENFGIFTLIEFAELYSQCNEEVKLKIANIMNTQG